MQRSNFGYNMKRSEWTKVIQYLLPNNPSTIHGKQKSKWGKRQNDGPIMYWPHKMVWQPGDSDAPATRIHVCIYGSKGGTDSLHRRVLSPLPFLGQPWACFPIREGNEHRPGERVGPGRPPLLRTSSRPLSWVQAQPKGWMDYMEKRPGKVCPLNNFPGR